MPQCGVGHSTFPGCLLLWRAAGALCPVTLGAGGAGVGTLHKPRSARSCELASLAVGEAQGTWRDEPRAPVWCVRGWALSLPETPVLGAGGWGLLPIFRGRRGCGHGDLSPTPQRTLLRAGFARCGGGTRALGGGGLRPESGVSGVRHPRCSSPRPLGRLSGPADAFPPGGPGHGTLRRTRKQAGRQSTALTEASSSNKEF